jgi:hypothetical protein
MKYKIKKIDQTSLHAGTFSTWLRNIRKALLENRGMNVPCGECDACCRSSYFIHIKPEETRTLNRIPKELLFPAPLRPEGHMVMGYDEHGRCPMLAGNKCSIYRNRPDTCRIFDCRVLAASGLALDDNDNNLIVLQARRWKFSCPTKRDHNLLSAVQSAATFLMRHTECVQIIWYRGTRSNSQFSRLKSTTFFLKTIVYPLIREKRFAIPKSQRKY